jgi:RNA polymerase sigma-70 factor (ECF subfamily)
MSREQVLAEEYTRCRSRLIRVAYALLGTRAEAEDVVSDCWLRLVAADARERIEDVEAWATVTVAHAALDVLRSARVRREEYVGPWLPEPLVGALPQRDDPAEQVTLHETVSFAVMVLLETLTPAERTSWALRELFGMSYDEIAGVVGRSPAAVRQLVTRARAHIAAGAPRVRVDSDQHSQAVAAFTRAATEGDLAALIKVLDPAVVLTSDGGGKVTAARRPVHGPDRVGRFLIGIANQLSQEERVIPLAVNGGPGFAVVDPNDTRVVCALTIHNGLVTRVDIVVSPDKLPDLTQRWC